MATQKQIGSTYNYMDKVWRACMGHHADISGAMYDGDFTMSLEAAQKRKHDYILEQGGFEKGQRVLDIGCGWGAFLNTVRERGGKGVGLTLSTKQAEYCQRRGLDVRLHDWKTVEPAEIGPFDSIASMGAFEHFCSIREYKAGKQEEIYRAFFKLCHDLLPEKGRLFLQTMTWGDSVPDPDCMVATAEPESDPWILYLVSSFYPGSWLPNGLEHTTAGGAALFDTIAVKNGREDYLETFDQWNVRLSRVRLRKYLAMLSVIPYLLTDSELRVRLRASRRSANKECFKRRLMDHFRIVLEKKGPELSRQAASSASA